MLQKTEKLPPKLQAVLAENKPDFVIRGGKKRFSATVDLLIDVKQIFFELVLIGALIYYFRDTSYQISNNSFNYHLSAIAVIAFLVILIYGLIVDIKENYKGIVNNACRLFCKSPYFAGTTSHFISFYRNELTMIPWKSINDSIEVRIINSTRGDLVLQTHCNEKYIDIYTQKEIVNIRELTLVQIEDFDKIAKLCLKRINQPD